VEGLTISDGARSTAGILLITIVVLAAEQRWERLSVYAVSYRQLLEQKAGV
jgi:hypothetical protein